MKKTPLIGKGRKIIIKKKIKVMSEQSINRKKYAHIPH